MSQLDGPRTPQAGMMARGWADRTSVGNKNKGVDVVQTIVRRSEIDAEAAAIAKGKSQAYIDRMGRRDAELPFHNVQKSPDFDLDDLEMLTAKDALETKGTDARRSAEAASRSVMKLPEPDQIKKDFAIENRFTAGTRRRQSATAGATEPFWMFI